MGAVMCALSLVSCVSDDDSDADTVAYTIPATTATTVEQLTPIDVARIVHYGDSLSWESRDFFADAIGDRAEVIDRTLGGTAICDWLDGTMSADIIGNQLGAAVVQFSGNNFTDCMLDEAGEGLTGSDLEARYRADAESVIALFVGNNIPVVFAGSPVAGPDKPESPLNDMYRQLAEDRDGVFYVDAGAAVLDDGKWTKTLPCRPDEPCEGGTDANGVGVNIVRAPDGIHFCPTGDDAIDGVTEECAVYDSGAHRFGDAMAAPVVDALDAAT